jgi:hypothetical protein
MASTININDGPVDPVTLSTYLWAAPSFVSLFTYMWFTGRLLLSTVEKSSGFQYRHSWPPLTYVYMVSQRSGEEGRMLLTLLLFIKLLMNCSSLGRKRIWYSKVYTRKFRKEIYPTFIWINSAMRGSSWWTWQFKLVESPDGSLPYLQVSTAGLNLSHVNRVRECKASVSCPPRLSSFDPDREKYTLWSCSLCNFLRPPGIFSVFDMQIFSHL